MSRTKVVYRCEECGAATPKWSGRCASCEAWNTLVEELEASAPALTTPAGAGAVPLPIGEVATDGATPEPTRIDEVDRVLGGGLVPGSVTLLGGEPGIGKSTLLLQLLARWQGRSLYVSAEESAQQVRMRAERLEAVQPELWLMPETSLPHIVAAIEQVRPQVVVVDSIQTIADPALSSAPGSVAQVRHCAHVLVGEAKRRGIAVLMVGHVTKEGNLAGPRVLEHVVDTVLAFEGDRHHALRLLRAVKHRFGPTSELGVFEMAGHGLAGVPDASGLFLADRRTGVPGSAVVPTLEGQRPLLVEVQALTIPVPNGVPPRRNAQGLDPGRLALLLAVLDRRARLPVSTNEVFASAVGGFRVTEPGADLALCLAVSSALIGRPLPPDLVAIGEVGLAGELRQAVHAPRRLAEAARMGFTKVICPVNTPDDVAGLRLRRVSTVSEALAAAGLGGGS
ncbi:MAG: DNA repair protein RadA [Acidobacteria bacterium]|nr:DNA repair protein RadA [Acidobacteriota bacterium]